MWTCRLCETTLINSGMLDMMTRLAGVLRGDTDTNVSLTTMPVLITLFTFSISSTKMTTAPFIRAADLMLLWPTTSPTAKLQSSTEHGKCREILTPCFFAEFGQIHAGVKHTYKWKLADHKTCTKPLEPLYTHTNTINTEYTYNYTLYNIWDEKKGREKPLQMLSHTHRSIHSLLPLRERARETHTRHRHRHRHRHAHRHTAKGPGTLTHGCCSLSTQDDCSTNWANGCSMLYWLLVFCFNVTSCYNDALQLYASHVVWRH